MEGRIPWELPPTCNKAGGGELSAASTELWVWYRLKFDTLGLMSKPEKYQILIFKNLKFKTFSLRRGCQNIQYQI